MSRVAKKPQFAAFNSRHNCYGRYQNHENDLHSWLQPEVPLMVELGAGTAIMSLAFHNQNPSWQVLAIDRKSDRLGKAARQLETENGSSERIAFLQTDLADLETYVDLKGQVQLLWLPFPDPYRRLRQAKHRLTHPDNLAIYGHLLADGGVIRFKTECETFFKYTQDVWQNTPWLSIKDVSHNLQPTDDKPADVLVETAYEQRWKALGYPVFYLEACKLPS